MMSKTVTQVSIKDIKNLALKVRKQALGEFSSKHGYPSDLLADVMSGLGIEILYTDSNKYTSATFFNRIVHRPIILISRKLSPNIHSYKRFFAISREVGNLFMFWHYQPLHDLDQSAVKFLKKNHQMFDKDNYILNVSPNPDVPRHQKEMDTFAKYFLNK